MTASSRIFCSGPEAEAYPRSPEGGTSAVPEDGCVLVRGASLSPVRGFAAASEDPGGDPCGCGVAGGCLTGPTNGAFVSAGFGEGLAASSSGGRAGAGEGSGLAAAGRSALFSAGAVAELAEAGFCEGSGARGVSPPGVPAGPPTGEVPGPEPASVPFPADFCARPGGPPDPDAAGGRRPSETGSCPAAR